MAGLSSLLWFCAILALIPATLWLLKRTPLGGGGTAGVLKSVASLPLSASQRIVTVEIGAGDERRWLVLGVTPSSITTLHTMAPQEIGVSPLALAAGGSPGTSGVAGSVAPAFAAMLARLQRGSRSGGDAR